MASILSRFPWCIVCCANIYPLLPICATGSYIPDYSRVRSGLQELLDDGYADEVVRLGKKLFSKGTKQVEQSHDEGDTVYEVADTLKIVFMALGECSISNVAKMEMAVDFRLNDEYDLCSGLEMFWNRRFSKKD